MEANAIESKFSFGSYTRLLSSPGHATLSLFGLLVRFPVAMRSISCIMLISAIMDSLWTAGTVAGALMISQAIASPVLGRLADRFSQRKILVITCCSHVVAIIALIALVLLNAHLWAMMVAAICAGCSSVPVDGFIRTRWASMVTDNALRTAYALETVLDEIMFLLGPLIAIVLATIWHPATGLALCAALTFSGSMALVLHRRSEPVIVKKTEENTRRAISMPWVRALMISYAAVGIFLGSIDVMMIAFAKEAGNPTLAGVLLSICAAGSLVGGICYGAMNWSIPQPRLLLITSVTLCAGTIPLVFTSSPIVMGISAFIAGLSVAPLLITCSNLLESLTPKGFLSEGFSWLSSAGWLGFSLGVSVGGQLSDQGGADQIAWMAMAAGILALLASLYSQRLLTYGLQPPHELTLGVGGVKGVDE
ncbi:MFS transporter [Pseudomonas sp. D47]|uniref:MFS transporter n=1 Tax=Pseudomonas sp. D47 TaxID=3159447 RepID=UPI00387A93BA